MKKQNWILTAIVLTLVTGAYAVGTYAVESEEIKLTEPTQEALDACAGKSEGNSCEYTHTGTKVAGVCQKSTIIDEDTTHTLVCQ